MAMYIPHVAKIQRHEKNVHGIILSRQVSELSCFRWHLVFSNAEYNANRNYTNNAF